jgi:hypothetical protein
LIISPIQPNEPTFGYYSQLKTLWRQGKLPSVRFGFYGDKLTQENLSLEHLRPKSKGGKTVLSNLVLASKRNNGHRSSKPLKDFINPETVAEYLNQFIDVQVEGFNGNKYIDAIWHTVHNILKGGKI